MANVFKQALSLIGVADSRSASPTETKGASGFANYNGFIEEKERNQQLTGTTKYITYSNALANTAIVGAGVRYFLNLVAKAKWSVTPADESPAAQEMADFIEETMGDMQTPWFRVIRRAAMYKFYGFSIQEWTAKRRDDGRLGMLDIESRPQFTIERWDTPKGRVEGIVQRSPQTQKEIYLPIEKLIYAVDDSLTDSPEGLGIFRHIIESVDRLKRYEQLEGFGFETDLRGMPIGRAPLTDLAEMVKNGQITDVQANKIIQPIRDFVSKGIKNPRIGMVIDSSSYRNKDAAASPSSVRKFDIELLQGSNTTQREVAEAINRVNHEIARLIGVENLLLGSDGKGTQALSRDKSHNFFLVIDSALTELEQTFDKNYIDRLWALNGFDENLKPRFKTEAIQFRDIEQITGALMDMANAGAVLDPQDPVIDEIRDLLGLSRRETVLSMMEDASLIRNTPPKNNEEKLPDDNEEREAA